MQDLDIEDEEEYTGESLASEFGAVRDAMGLKLPEGNGDGEDDGHGDEYDDEYDDTRRNYREAHRLQRWRRRLRRRSGESGGNPDRNQGEYFDSYVVDEPEEYLDDYDEETEQDGLGFEMPRRPPRTNQDAADAAGAGVVAALMEVCRSPLSANPKAVDSVTFIGSEGLLSSKSVLPSLRNFDQELLGRHA